MGEKARGAERWRTLRAGGGDGKRKRRGDWDVPLALEYRGGRFDLEAFSGKNKYFDVMMDTVVLKDVDGCRSFIKIFLYSNKVYFSETILKM